MRKNQESKVWGHAMTIKEKLELAGLAVGITATFVWTGFIAFLLSLAIARFL
jgi:hypothetical protein